jgi:hypothetical protein
MRRKASRGSARCKGTSTIEGYLILGRLSSTPKIESPPITTKKMTPIPNHNQWPPRSIPIGTDRANIGVVKYLI